MPKKTKKEKILAMYHKKLRMLENRQVVASPIQTKTPVVVTKTIEPVNQYFFSDLRKSLLLIFLILVVEVGLYFVNLIK